MTSRALKNGPTRKGLPDFSGSPLKHFLSGVEEGAGDDALYRTRREQRAAYPSAPPMNSDSTKQRASSRDSAAPSDSALCSALHRGLGQPITALRASMESIVREFEPEDPRGTALDEALGEVARLGRNVRDLIDYAYPPEPHSLKCLIDEILYSARLQLPRNIWPHLWIARDLPNGLTMPEIRIDGPVLSRSLARLIQAAGSTPSNGILLRASSHAGEIHFTITIRGISDLEDDPTGLCHSIAQRDLAVIGCLVEESTARCGDTIIRVRIPMAPKEGSA